MVSCNLEESVKTNAWGKLVLLVSAASYVIYLLHTTFEGVMKALIIKLPYLSDLSNDIMFSIGAFLVVSTGIVVPVILFKNVLRRYSITRVLFGLT